MWARARLVAPVVLTACDAVRDGGPGNAKPGSVLAKVSDVPVGGGALVGAGTNGLILLTRPKAGEIRGFNPTCPHVGAKVRPPQGNVIRCPAHGSQFNATTGALLRGPAPHGLAEVAITVPAGKVRLGPTHVNA
ncbi:MAG TPA: Rieske (2Fe-2S) protein [Pseudonocardiaceae bacterium]|nr:Rieske (2Fe-2S) protein [Pseudonocardiaceae bacterium]